MSQQAAKRRRQQAKAGYKHMSPQSRPHYKRRSAGALARRLDLLVQRENEMRMRSKKK